MGGRYLIVSDVDGTLLGDDAALDLLVEWLRPRRDCVLLALNSGRLIPSLRDSVAATALPTPDAYIGGVGTEIFDECAGRPLADWPADDGGWDAAAIRETLADVDALTLQPEEFLSPHKVSYYVREATSDDLAAWRRRLNEQGLAVQLVYSSQRDLDVLPAGVNKGAAAAHLARTWEIAADRVIVCGDTCNDLSMFQQGFRGVIVGNALPELKALDGPGVYHSRRSFAAGVVEGVEYWMRRESPGC